MQNKNYRTLSDIFESVMKDDRFSYDLKTEICELVGEAFEVGARMIMDSNKALSEEFARADADLRNEMERVAA
ncbi:MAG: hypothetical protein ABF824_05270 [Acetobacter sp.]